MTNKYTGINPHNSISSELNRAKFLARNRGPDVVLRYKWHQEFISKGLDKKMAFSSYLKKKTKEWYNKKHKPKGMEKNSNKS